MEDLSAIILAAGEGKRMKSKKSKVLHKVCGKELIQWVYDAVQNAGIRNSVVVVGHKAEQVMEFMGEGVRFALQKEQLGTGHAVLQAQSAIQGRQGHVIILNGDTPLIKSETIKRAFEYHIHQNNAATIITTKLDDATGYGRVIRDSAGHVVRIVEHKDATEEERAVNEINSGMYCFTISSLLDSLSKISNNNSQGEYYLTDTIEILINNGQKVGAITMDDSTELLGINNRIQLAEVEAIMRRKILNMHMEQGVTIVDPANTYIGPDVRIGNDTVILPGCIIEGNTVIGEDCIIGPQTNLVNSTIERNVEVKSSVVIDSFIDEGTHVGPFAYLRPGSRIGKNVKVGDFVEIKNSIIGDNTKVSHLTYVGDSEVGKNVNFGCGTVTVNYDGIKKHKTIIGDNAFIGCNTNLVSPVVVNRNAYIAAGSTITDEVPENSLAIARSRQVIKEGWVKKHKTNE